jgi:hypothetical protein
MRHPARSPRITAFHADHRRQYRRGCQLLSLGRAIEGKPLARQISNNGVYRMCAGALYDSAAHPAVVGILASDSLTHLASYFPAQKWPV